MSTEDETMQKLTHLRSEILEAVRRVAKVWGGGFAGVSYMSAPSIAEFMRGHGPFERPAGEALLDRLKSFDDASRNAAGDSAQLVETTDTVAVGEGILADIQRWLSTLEEHPT